MSVETDELLVKGLRPGGFNFINLSGASSYVVKSGAGTLHALILNTPIASGVITMYANSGASGTVIGTITNPATLLNEGPFTVLYDVTFVNGLTVKTSAADDLTVIYK